MTTNLNIIAINRRMFNMTEAAQYCGVPIKKFPGICKVQPVELGDKIVRYDKNALDRWLDELACGNSGHDEIDEIIGRLE